MFVETVKINRDVLNSGVMCENEINAKYARQYTIMINNKTGNDIGFLLMNMFEYAEWEIDKKVTELLVIRNGDKLKLTNVLSNETKMLVIGSENHIDDLQIVVIKHTKLFSGGFVNEVDYGNTRFCE